MTGGAGHILDMMARLRMNNSTIRKKRPFKHARKEYILAAKQKHIDYHRATPQQLEEIRMQVLINRDKSRLQMAVSFVLTIILSSVLMWGLWYLFRIIWDGWNN